MRLNLKRIYLVVATALCIGPPRPSMTEELNQRLILEQEHALQSLDLKAQQELYRRKLGELPASEQRGLQQRLQQQRLQQERLHQGQVQRQWFLRQRQRSQPEWQAGKGHQQMQRFRIEQQQQQLQFKMQRPPWPYR